MGEYDTLGHPGGAAGVHDDSGVLRLRRRGHDARTAEKEDFGSTDFKSTIRYTLFYLWNRLNGHWLTYFHSKLLGTQFYISLLSMVCAPGIQISKYVGVQSRYLKKKKYPVGNSLKCIYYKLKITFYFISCIRIKMIFTLNPELQHHLTCRK